MWNLRFSERHWCFAILNAVCSYKVTSLYFGQIRISTGFKDSTFQNSTGLEPSKFSPQVTPLCKKPKSAFYAWKFGLSGNSCFHSVLLCLAWWLHKVNFTFHWQDLCFEGQQQPSYMRLRFVFKLRMLGKKGKDNKNFLIRKSLLLLSCTTRLLSMEPWHRPKAGIN